MMAKLAIPIAVLLLLSAIALLLWLWLWPRDGSALPPVPPNRDVIARFREHRADFEALRRLVAKDRGWLLIAPAHERPVARFQPAVALLHAIGAESVERRGDGSISVTMYDAGPIARIPATKSDAAESFRRDLIAGRIPTGTTTVRISAASVCGRTWRSFPLSGRNRSTRWTQPESSGS